MRQRPSKSGRYMQPWHIEYLKEHGENLTTMQLAKATGFTQPVIWAWCKKLNITPTKACFQFGEVIIPVCEKPEKNI